MSLGQRWAAWRKFGRRFFRNRLVIVSVVILAGAFFGAGAAPWISPADPTHGSMRARLRPPSEEHVLGTDQQGRDVLSRMIWGSRIAIQVGIIATSIALGIGVTLGLVAGYFGGIVETIIMRMVDVAMAFPYILLVIGIVTILGFGLVNAMIALGIAYSPEFARLVRATVLGLRDQEYVISAKALGASERRIVVRHVLPNVIGPVFVLVALVMARAILAEAGLSFLGLGAQPPTPSWGSMIATGREYLVTHPYLSIIPGVAIMLVIFALNTVGDALRDILDPRGVT